MKYKSLYAKLLESSLQASVVDFTSYSGHTIVETNEGVFVDGTKTFYSSLSEAKASISQTEILNAAKQDLYEVVSNERVAQIIRENSDQKLTNTLIEAYINMAQSKAFTTDKIVQEIRDLNRFDNLVEDRCDYILDDGNTVVITRETQKMINTLPEESVNYMKSSVSNFLEIADQIKE